MRRSSLGFALVSHVQECTWDFFGDPPNGGLLCYLSNPSLGISATKRKAVIVHFKPKYQSGFTIVELLIVIVVITILAAISITSYTGIQDRAKATQLVSMRNAVDKAFRLVAQDKGWTGYPRDNTIVGSTANPQIAAIAATPDFANYIQPSVVPAGISAHYDNDLDVYNGCSAGSLGTAIYVNNISSSISEKVDQQIDDGNATCGMVTYSGSTLKLYLSKGYDF